MLEVVQLGVSWLVHPVHGSGPGPDVQIVVGDVVDVVAVGRGGRVVVAWTVLLKVGENLQAIQNKLVCRSNNGTDKVNLSLLLPLCIRSNISPCPVLLQIQNTFSVSKSSSSRFKGFLRLLVREDVKSLLRLDKSDDLSSADEGNRSLSLDVNTFVVVEKSSAASSIEADADVFFALDSAMSPFVEPGNSSPLTLMACKCTKHGFTFLNFTFEQNHSFYEPLINSLAVIEKS